ncbi:hypothetical protein HRbin09_01505 [bacterium HR09]|nr:hypothetical protein HRbin09_01505 [bacterium HR09]
MRRGVAGTLEVGGGGHVRGERPIKDLLGLGHTDGGHAHRGLTPRVRTAGYQQVVGQVGNTAVTVHAAVVVAGRGRAVGIKPFGVVVGRVTVGGGVVHVTEGVAGSIGRVAHLADLPGVGGNSAIAVGLDVGPINVGPGLVKGPGFRGVSKVGGPLGNTVGQLVGYHVQGVGKRRKGGAIAVAKHHLRTVPEGVVVLIAVVHGSDELHAGAVNGVAVELGLVVVVGVAQVVVGSHGYTIGGGATLHKKQGAGERGAVVGGVNLAVQGTVDKCFAGDQLAGHGIRVNPVQMFALGIAKGHPRHPRQVSLPVLTHHVHKLRPIQSHTGNDPGLAGRLLQRHFAGKSRALGQVFIGNKGAIDGVDLAGGFFGVH